MCEICGVQKFVRYNVPMDDVRFGKAFPCPGCNRDGVIMASGLNPQERKTTLDALQLMGRPGTARMVAAARRFIDGDYKGFLSICGGYGNGKTSALKAIVNDCINRGIEARYITLSELMAYAREAFDSQQAGDSDYGRISRIALIRVVCIDELDKARVTEYAREIQTHFFDVRYRRAHELGTVCAWNGDEDAIGLPWVKSRMSQFEIVTNNDPDIRSILKELK